MARATGIFVLCMALSLAAPLAARAADAQPADATTSQSRSGPRVDAVVPVDPHEHERLHFFDGRAHHVLPGTVTIDRDPYVCDVDGRRFEAEDAFVAHLRTAHRVPPDAIQDRVTVRGGIVHFAGN